MPDNNRIISRNNTLTWIQQHMDELKVDNESEDIDEMVVAMQGDYIQGNIGLTKALMEGKSANEN